MAIDKKQTSKDQLQKGQINHGQKQQQSGQKSYQSNQGSQKPNTKKSELESPEVPFDDEV